MYRFNFDDRVLDDEDEINSLKGSNFLVSAVYLLRKQKKDLLEENRRLKAQLETLESHNASLVNVSADRLLGRMV